MAQPYVDTPTQASYTALPSDYTKTDYSLGKTLEDVYNYGRGRQQAIVDMGRRMAELTIPEVMTPEGYKVGDNIPGNNQSVGAYCVNNLSSKLMFQALPPGLPMLSIDAIEYEVQAQIAQDPQLWANMKLAFAGLERAHRTRLHTTTYQTTFTQYLKLLLVAGNGAWKHIELERPTFYTPHDIVCRRDQNGLVRHGVARDQVALVDLDEDDQKFVYDHTLNAAEVFENDWVKSVNIYTGCKLIRPMDEGEYRWQYWQEYNGCRIPDTEVTTDYDIPPIRYDWLIPVYRQDYGRSYCEEYRGDLFAVEALASGITDGAAIAAFMLMLVQPGSTTSIRQIREAKNLSTLPGRAEDISMFRSEKTQDLSFVAQTLETSARRLDRAFLLQSSIQRSGERVTKEEIVRLGNELDRAMGGTYSAISQSVDRPSKLRFMRLNEEKNPKLPPLPKGVVEVQVTSGVDAMGLSDEAGNLLEFGLGVNQVFGPQGATQRLSGGDWTTRFAAAKGIDHPESLVKSDQQIADQTAQEQQAAMQHEVVSKAAGPLAGAAGQAIAGRLAPPQPPQPQGQ